MKCYIGLGSNQGDRLANLEQAAQRLKAVSQCRFRASPIYSTRALLQEGAPQAWNIPYLNAVIEMEWEESAHSLLRLLKRIESELGRNLEFHRNHRWAPRVIDLDVLFFGHESIADTELKIPHPGVYDRSFVLDPLKHLAGRLPVGPKGESTLNRSRSLTTRAPAWMAILNLTPDSFSDGGVHTELSRLTVKITALEEAHVQIFDLGAESTRPTAEPVSPHEEWQRLQPSLEFLRDRYRDRIFKPKLSVDTRHMSTAIRALEYEVDCINDVSGLSHPDMGQWLSKNSCDYVLMHGLSVPADPNRTLHEDCDPVAEVRAWVEKKMNDLSRSGVSMEKVIFDPGIGFGKTAEQSLQLVRRIDEFFDLNLRILVGHSRKSFLSLFSKTSPLDRDPESIGLSLYLASRGVDILRVHEADIHSRVHRMMREMT